MKKTILAVTVLVVCAVPKFHAQSSLKAIVGGTLVNTNEDSPVENAVILVKDAQIIEAGTSKNVKVPDGAQIIDAKGKWIIPGLIDAHVHFFQSGGLYTRPDVIDLRKQVPYEKELTWIREHVPDTLARYLRCGITGVADVGGPFWNFEVRKLAEQTPMAPRVAVAGPLVSTYQPAALTTDDPPIIKVHSPEEARALVRRQVEEKPDLIKIWYIVRPGERPEDHLPLVEATMEESRKHGLRVAVHATQLETARAAVKAGADVLVHSVTDQEVDEEFIQLLKKNDVVYTTTLVVFEGYAETLSQQITLTPAEQELANPYVVSTLFDLRKLPAEDIPPSTLARIKNPRPISPNPAAVRNLKLLQAAGVTIAAGTDAGNIGTLHGPSLFREFEIMAEAGLTPAQILKAATINSAKVMGRESQVGTIEKGKLADLVILNADPLADIRNTSDVHLVIKNGDVYAPAEIIKKTPEDIVQQQVNAYNARDLEAFLATYSPDIVIRNQRDNSVIVSGPDEMRKRYRARFESSPELHAEIVRRIVFGNFVIDRERVTGIPGMPVANAVAIYEVSDNLIQRVWFVFE